MRIEGWEKRLAEYVADERPFSWGQHDCCLWAARWVEICTGADHYSGWMEQYSSEEEARSLLSARGFSSYSDIVDATLTVTPIMLAQRGDLMLHPSCAIGICNGRVSHFIGPKGHFAEKTLDCLRSWKVV